MASSKPIPCGPCQEGKVNTKSDIWCYNCDKGLCSSCSGLHKISKLSRDHKTVDINMHKPSMHAITIECDKHGQQLNLYCPSHLMPCCNKCISTNHSKCTGIKNLAAVVEKTLMEESKEYLDTDIYSTIDILNTMVKNKLGNIKRGEQQCESIKETIAKFRKKINKHLDHLEEKLFQDIVTMLNEEKSKASNLITELGEQKVKLNKMKSQLHTAITKSSKLQSFLEVHQIEQQIHQCQRYVEDLEADDKTKEFDIKLKHNYEIDKTISNFESLKSFGEVFMDKSETSVKRETSVRREAQVKSVERSNIYNMTMNIETITEINIEKRISDMICLMDGRVLVVEEDNKINLFTPDGKLEKQLTISGGANSVTQINQDTIAMTYHNEKAIKIFNLEKEIVTKVITLDKECWSLSFSDNSLAVGLSENKIRFINLEGATLKSIHGRSESLLDFLIHCNDRVIYSDYNGNAIYCVGSGGQIWKYKQDGSYPNGLCTDYCGNIFVVDPISYKITAISKDGQDSKVLISKEGDLKNPRCICFNPNHFENESSGFICDFYGTYLAKFNLSYVN